MKKKETLMPALFLAHGSPMNAITLNRFSLSWHQLGLQLPKPRAILVVSAHFTTQGQTAITAMDRPNTIHDFVGFPNELVDLVYPAKGASFLASHIVKTLEEFTHIYEDYTDWGLDHGAWTILANMYPDADIPVLELSLDMTKPIAYHHQFGRALSELRRQGILLIGSGNVVHNLRSLKWELDQTPYTWADDFNQFVHENLDSHAFTEDHPLVNFQSHPDSLLANPTIEHYLPMLYILGAWTGREKLQVFNNVILQGSLSMLSFMVGDDELNLSLESENLVGAAYGSFEAPPKLELDFFADYSADELAEKEDSDTDTELSALQSNTELVSSLPDSSNLLEQDDNQSREEDKLTQEESPTVKKRGGFFKSKLRTVAKKLKGKNDI
ncbi:Aromatic ring-opening dioxygenase, catalytic subunit, LigB family [Thorsellia anophelis DSM 18579]|uniref:Aromatic ring-opening dioxygenase, catalytic subunit, LigB family n=1 Tax=Thorsellia anophelis DSM 18579 TaxID=1123402 RepID=A0A1I0B668_9GAMM|nr:Aromatic ring-opening dioxygenase, catalytic subunit, LigB family [Thorsellia anophelis DSM 18579]